MTDPQPPGPRRIPRPVPVHPVLFAIYPALFLYSQNVGEVAARDVVIPLLVLASGALLALVVLSLPFRDPRRAAIVVSAVAIAASSYGFFDRALPRQVTALAQQIGWILVILAAIVVAIRIRRWLGTLTTVLNGLSAILVILTLVTIVPFLVGTIGTSPATASTAPATDGATDPGAATTKRDIYYIILDRYGSARSLAQEYGITDNDFYGWLADRGFTVAADSHANYVKTPLSIASTLRMDFLDDIVARMGKDSGDHQPVFDVFQDHPVGRFLKSRGYRYFHIGSTYQPTKESRLADVNLHANTVSDFDTALYDLSALPAIGRRLGWLSSDPKRERQRSYTQYEFEALERVRSEPGPKFVFAHFLMPHPPYVFTADGTYVPRTTATGPATFETQLAYTNARMKAFIEPLLALPEAERPIIIIQGDEGPFPKRYNADTTNFDWSTATAKELEMKYGILNAMYLPGLPPGKQLPYPTISSVNTFRLLFDDYFDQDLPLLPDRSFTSKAKFRPYDLTEITDKLPSLGP